MLAEIIMRAFALAPLLLAGCATASPAGPFRNWAGQGEEGNLPIPPRFPRVAALANPGPPFTRQYSPPVSDGPVRRAAPTAIYGTLWTMSWIPPSPFYIIGTAGLTTIRATHLGLNGPVYPGQPFTNTLWLVSPLLADIRDRRKGYNTYHPERRQPPPTVAAPPGYGYYQDETGNWIAIPLATE